MKLTMSIAASLLLIIAASASAQTPADPVSGTWTGHLGQNGQPKADLTITMKLAGQSVTGSVTGPPEPGEIKTGTFDPTTGALKLDIVVGGDPNKVAIFEGTLADGVAAGRVTLPNQAGYFKLVKAGATTGAAPAGGDPASAVRTGFNEVSGWVTQAADLVPADKYTYRPVDTVRTYGQLIAHIADGYNYFCGRAAGRSVQWSDAIEKGNTDKATVTAKLKESLEACNNAYASGAVPMLMANVAHTSLHYGNAITYVRMLGLVPPSSR
jgi:hypothetical protein